MDMDRPLCTYERRPLAEDSLDIDDDDTCGWVKRALIQDNKDDFVELINSYSVEELEDDIRPIRVFMFTEDAAKCAAAVLDGETQISDVTYIMSCNPLHKSVSYRAKSITALLLERGFSADVRCDWGSSLPHVLPLGIALSKVRIFTALFLNENESISALKFTIELFRGLATAALETLRLLAMNTRDIKHEFFNYLKEGKMVEVGALLFVARSRILSSSTGKGEFSSILEMRDFLSEEMTSYTNSKTLLSARDDKLIEMEQTLVLLQIFDTVGDKLAALIRQDFRHCPIFFSTLAAASLLEDAGFDVNAEDIATSRSCKMIQHRVLERDADDCKKKAFTTNALPRWLKGGALSGLTDRSLSSSRHTYPLSSKIALSPMSTVASTPSTPEIIPLQYLLKQKSPSLPEIIPLNLLKQSLGTLTRVIRRG